MDILIADDDARFLNSLKLGLESEYHVQTVQSISEIKNKIRLKRFDLLVSDYDFGHENIISFLKEEPLTLPTIIMTGKATKETVIEFLNLGVDRLIEKPVRLQDLKNHILQLVRSQQIYNTEALKVLEIDEVKPFVRTVKFHSKELTLTPSEFKILDYFLKHMNLSVNRLELNQIMWPNVKVTKNTLDTHLYNLKKKIPTLKDRLVSIYGGYYILKMDINVS